MASINKLRAVLTRKRHILRAVDRIYSNPVRLPSVSAVRVEVARFPKTPKNCAVGYAWPCDLL